MDPSAIPSVCAAFAAVLRDQPDEQLAELLRSLPDDRLAELAAEAYQRKHGAAPPPPPPPPAPRVVSTASVDRVSKPATVKTGGKPNGHDDLATKLYSQIVLAKDGIGRRELQKRTGIADSMIGHLLRKLVQAEFIRLQGNRASAKWFATAPTRGGGA